MNTQEMEVVSEFTQALYEADIAGVAAAARCNPQMLTVQGYESEPFPICGFAWVTFRPATTRFVRFMKKKGVVSKAYGGGASLWVSKFGQSYDKKLAYADAFSASIRKTIILSGLEPTLKVYSAGRLD